MEQESQPTYREDAIDKVSNRQLSAAKFILYFSVGILIFFTASNYYYQNLPLFYSNGLLLLVVLTTVVFFRKNIFLLAQLLFSLMAIGILMLIYFNQGKEYVPVWCFVFIHIAMIIYGHKKGLWVTIGFCAIALAMLYVWVGQELNMLAFLRLTSVLAVSTIFSYLAERNTFITLNQLITTQKNLNEMTKIDPLTDIYNRRQFDQDFEASINSAKRLNEPVAFAMLDIDYFKLYNDTYGHQSGDDTLIKISALFKQRLKRASDKVYRLGGEEFALLCHAKQEQAFIELLSEILTEVEQLGIEHKLSDVSDHVTVSAGLLMIKPDESITIQQAYKTCDARLYKAKHQGRNRVCHS